MSPRRWVAAAGCAVLLSGCTSFADTLATQQRTTAPAEVDVSACPADRAEPDPDRPRVDLRFRLEDDLRTVTGTETVTFTPDLPVDELLFRLVPNAPRSAESGNRLEVHRVRGSDVTGGRYEPAGAEAPGGLYVVDLDRELGAGESTRVELDFTVSLGRAAFDRLGSDDGVSWWASGAPLLAWEPGVGWAEDPFVPLSGETTTSSAADTTIEVSAPAELAVLMTGEQAAPSAPRNGRRTWTAADPAARDVSVAAGEFTTAEGTTPGGVRVTTGVLPGAELSAGRLTEWTLEAIDALEAHLGPFPYRTLTVPNLGDYGGGVEYPGSILQATPSRSVLVHEVAHMWFYGMVGNSQFRDPWLDEAFATYAEAVVNPSSAAELLPLLDLPGDVGGGMADFASYRRYSGVVYGKGAAALLTARTTVGPDAFDAAIRCYVDANAWTVATPVDLGAALAALPDAVAVLDEAGALATDDVPR